MPLNFPLLQVQMDCRGCDRCPLSKTRKNIVFGRGNVQAKAVVIGEAPAYSLRNQANKDYPDSVWWQTHQDLTVVAVALHEGEFINAR